MTTRIEEKISSSFVAKIILLELWLSKSICEDLTKSINVSDTMSNLQIREWSWLMTQLDIFEIFKVQPTADGKNRWLRLI